MLHLGFFGARSKVDDKSLSFPAWSESHATGIEFVDIQHKRLFELASLIRGEARASGGDPLRFDSFRKAVADTMDYAKTHISQEEQWMRDTKFPQLEAHKKEHVGLVRELLSAAADIPHGDSGAAIAFADAFSEHLGHHVSRRDLLFKRHRTGRAKTSS